MAMVMIRCPVTGRQVFTGIETDPASISLVPPINARLHCPACGDEHVWSILAAELVDQFDCPQDNEPTIDHQLERLSRRAVAGRR